MDNLIIKLHVCLPLAYPRTIDKNFSPIMPLLRLKLSLALLQTDPMLLRPT